MSQILIVEDELRLAAFIEKGLRQKGFTTFIAADGMQALTMAGSQKVDLLLLDLGLPGIDGISVLQELRKQGEQFPIIVITARTDDGDRQTALASGANDFMAKPFRFNDLLARVRIQLGIN
jgi:two-component system, OmpR family, copper resistance phosphate regulon response regulator CusR